MDRAFSTFLGKVCLYIYFFNVSVASSLYSRDCSTISKKKKTEAYIKWVMLKFMFKGNMPLEKGDLGHVKSLTFLSALDPVFL